MAEKKTSGKGKTTKKPNTAAKKTKAAGKKTAPPKIETKKTGKKKKPVEIPLATPVETFGSDILGLILIALGVLFALYLYGKQPDKGIGYYIYWLMFNAVGLVAYALPPVCVVLGLLVMAGRKRTPAAGRVPVFILLILFIAALIQLIGGINYLKPEAGRTTGETFKNVIEAIWGYIKTCSERSLGTVKNSTRGGGVLGGFICLVFYIIGGQGLCAVAVVAGLVISLLLVTRISLKTFPDYLVGSVSRMMEKIDPEDDGTEDTEYVPFSGMKRKLYDEMLADAPEKDKEKDSGEEGGEEDEDIELGHLSEVNYLEHRLNTHKKPRPVNYTDSADDDGDGIFNNEPIDDTLPMEPELRVKDMREEAKKASAKKETGKGPVLFGADEGSFLNPTDRPAPAPEPELNLFGEDTEPPKPARPRPVRPQPAEPVPAEPKPAEPKLFGTDEPAQEKQPAPEPLPEDDAGEKQPAPKRQTVEELKESLEARPYTEAEKAERNADKVAPKFRPVDEVTGEPLPEAQEAPAVYEPFSLDCLSDPPHNYSKATDDPEQVGKLLVETLKNFNIEAKLLEWSIGPVVTRYELQPAPGVRVSKITALANDIALALAATRVRIEAPIPNKAAVGIEVPNKKATSVYLKEIINSDAFMSMKSPVSMAMGKDIGGKIVVADLAKMPHMLIAGSTGSGKSVCINNLILSMVFKSSPADLRLIMVDPKQVELSVYAYLPHLLIPVVTDPKKASSALRWAVNEMTLRYSKFKMNGARDLNRYNSLQLEEKEKLPRIVVIIDELADLMMVCPEEVEDSICRLAQLGRAAGIHLIVATQRPSSDVITGLIKTNIPSRAAFAVASAIDSRIILDTAGAEKLLGKGDCLFHPNGADKPTRLQAAFVSDEEVEQVMEHYKTDKEPVFETAILDSVNNTAEGGAKGGVFGEGKQEDDLLGEAVRIVLDSGQASISMIQRKLRVGYARAARLVDMMEEKGYVSGFDGSKPRKVLIKRAEFEALFGDGGAVLPDEEPGANAEDGYVPEEYRE